MTIFHVDLTITCTVRIAEPRSAKQQTTWANVFYSDFIKSKATLNSCIYVWLPITMIHGTKF